MRIIHVEMLDTALSGPGLNPDCGHCVVLLGKTFYSHSAKPDLRAGFTTGLELVTLAILKNVLRRYSNIYYGSLA